jgi:nitroreductase
MSDDCNAIMKIIKGRRSIRRFKSKPVEREKIETLLEAARWAPSAGNAQPWDFIIITDSRTIQGLKTVMTGVMGNMKEGPVLILVCSNRNRETAWSRYDIGCALQNILLCAHCMGLGACAIGGFDEGMIVKLLDLPEDSKPCLFITAGYPESGVPVPRRRAVKEIIRREV